eukprot:TRINITY_DN7661_c0_g1_i6.p1 TRINITY_DN7661_c0_g1~~TRINITY_DN7661_c0_g1_i6.p1  ORF type:complete len:239 (-),score=29.30 TRINITY_DN7661_c0_g1_i6:589-1305(-)
MSTAKLGFLICIATLHSVSGTSEDLGVSWTTGESLFRDGYTLHSNLSSCGMQVYWKPLVDELVWFAVTRQTNGYVAIGWPRNGSFQMIGSDAVIGYLKGDAISVEAYFLAAKVVSGIVLNPLMNLSNVNLTRIDGVTTLYFTRNLMTGYNPITDPTAMSIIYSSHDEANQLVEHTCITDSVAFINLINGSSQGSGEDNARENVHGSLMMIGWSLFIASGVFFARYSKKILAKGLWFQV